MPDKKQKLRFGLSKGSLQEATIEKMGKAGFNILGKVLRSFCVLALATTLVMAQSNEDRRKEIEKREQAKPSKEAMERKMRSVARLKKEGVPTIDHLPVIEDSKESKRRRADDIAKRAIAICMAAVKAEGIEQETVDSLVKRYGAEKFLSPEEAALIKDPNPSERDRIKFSWRYEGYWVLLWALGYVESLDRPERVCDVAKAVTFLKGRSTEEFIKSAKLRSLEEILDEADLIYRYNWAVTDARVNSKEKPGRLDGGVVQERHYVLNWLIGYMDQQWDEISTDT